MRHTSESLNSKKMARVWCAHSPFYHLEYGRVQKMLGNGRVECYCYDGKTRLCNIRGKMRKKVRLRRFDSNRVGVDWCWRYRPYRSPRLPG